MMWLVVTVAMMASSSTLLRKKSKTATRWMTLAGTGGETPAGVSFFGVPQTDVLGTNFDLSSDFSIFLRKCG